MALKISWHIIVAAALTENQGRVCWENVERFKRWKSLKAIVVYFWNTRVCSKIENGSLAYQGSVVDLNLIAAVCKAASAILIGRCPRCGPQLKWWWSWRIVRYLSYLTSKPWQCHGRQTEWSPEISFFLSSFFWGEEGYQWFDSSISYNNPTGLPPSFFQVVIE